MDADLKTLRLANPDLTAAALARFVAYQRALVAYAASHPEGAAPGWEGRMAFAHAAALKESGATADDVSRLSPLLADYCGRQSSLRTLRAKREELRAAKDPKGRERLAKLEGELARLEADGALAARYGAERLALLASREDELVELHQRVAAAFGGGHLHRP